MNWSSDLLTRSEYLKNWLETLRPKKCAGLSAIKALAVSLSLIDKSHVHFSLIFGTCQPLYDRGMISNNISWLGSFTMEILPALWLSAIESMVGLQCSWQISSKPCHDHGKMSCQGCHCLGKSVMEIHDLGKGSMVSPINLVRFLLHFSWTKISLRSLILELKTIWNE